MLKNLKHKLCLVEKDVFKVSNKTTIIILIHD
jgi:hypothetical protein